MDDIMDGFRAAMNEDSQKTAQKTYNRPGWLLRYLPTIPLDTYLRFEQIVGMNDIYWVNRVNYNRFGTLYVAGQLLISPQGRQRVAVWMEENGTPLSK